MRRYDIDWLRVIAIALLLVYHVAIGFQAWGIMIGFITNKEPWPSLWLPMSMLNVWRIPFLFFVSGMGVFFAMQHRTWVELIKERSLRILVPYIAGMIGIFPISMLIFQQYNGFEIQYAMNAGHLWFLGNIMVYVLILFPLFFYLTRESASRFVNGLKGMLRTPLGLLPVIGIFILEALIVKPYPYELYANTWHGFWLGLLAFFTGFCLMLVGEVFWPMIVRWRWLFPAIALTLFVTRILVFGMQNPVFLLVIESDCWIFSMFAFGHKYLNHKSKALTYLSEAAYPVYILHMIFLYLGSWLVFPMEISVELKFVFVLSITFAGCFASFEVVRRVQVLRVLFGLKSKWTTKKERLIIDKGVARTI